jgi:hypothetical protein
VIFLLERTVRVGTLFDFYGQLLTERQQQMVKLYYYHDLSLGEIAEQSEISRQAVYDNLKRAEKLLEDYEEKLKLLNKQERIKKKSNKLIETIESLSGQISEDDEEILNNIATGLIGLLKGGN